jgi:serine/threonine protein kinase
MPDRFHATCPWHFPELSMEAVRTLLRVGVYDPSITVTTQKLTVTHNETTDLYKDTTEDGTVLVRKHILAKSSGADPWKIRKSFFREVLYEAYCSCSLIQGVTSIGYRNTNPATFVFQQPFLSKDNLADYLRKGRLSPLAAWRVVFSTVAAIYYLHRFKIFHRDIKPTNYVMSTTDSKPICDRNVSTILIDFGLTRSVADDNNASQVPGTPQYMAPEMNNDSVCAIASDMYAWAMILYEIIECKQPWTGDRGNIARKVAQGRRPPQTKTADAFKLALTGMMEKAWEQNTTLRSTAEEVFEQFVTDTVERPRMKDEDEANLAEFVQKVAEELRNKESEVGGRSPVANPTVLLVTDLLRTKSHAAMRALRARAKGGCSQAQEVVGMLYHEGIIVDRDDVRAWQYLAGAMTGEARQILAEMEASTDLYVRGCIQQAQGHLDEAAHLYLDGARLKSRECVTQLGKLLSKQSDQAPLPVQRVREGIRLLTLGRKMGDRKAAFILGRRYWTVSTDELNRDELNRDERSRDERSRDELNHAVELGHPFAADVLYEHEHSRDE